MATTLTGTHTITPGDATTLATWVTALATASSDVIVMDPNMGSFYITPLCDGDNTDFTCVVWSLNDGTWTEVTRLSWSGSSTNEPESGIYSLPTQRVVVPHTNGHSIVAIGRTAGTGTWTAKVTGGE